jgi:L-alanine-DL-glutamate epimerase-like enolase superfamily enzyme
MPAPITIRNCDIFLVTLETRMPFKYGIATMTRVPHAFVRVEADVGSERGVGISADLLPPKWFTKNPDKPLAEEIDEMLRVIQQAARDSIGQSGNNAFDLWKKLYDRQTDWGRGEKLPSLLTHFGSSMVERALIEATARALKRPFAQMVRDNTFGIQLETLHPALKGKLPSDFLPHQPLKRITVRHTVGLVDPLRDSQIAVDQRLHDGLPQSLEACIQFYGLRHFKIKVTGHLDHDLDRLEQIAILLSARAHPDYRFTLDGNEQFQSAEVFRAYWQAVSTRPTLKNFLTHLSFIEQPLHRDSALAPEVAAMFSDWKQPVPVIIDESDATVESLPHALALGYSGASHKNCKGIFKGLANRCLLAWKLQHEPGRPWIMSGEDLCTIGPVSVVQDLTVMSTLGIESVERNGHHYFPGLSMLPKKIQDQVLQSQSGIYRASAKGWPMLDVRDGQLDVHSLHEHPFGVGFMVNPEQFTPADKYRFNDPTAAM